MEKEMSGSTWRTVKRALLATLVIASFGYIYVQVLIFASAHTKVGNIMLGLVTAFGAFLAIILITQIYHVTRPLSGRFGRWLTVGIVVATFLHTVGALVPIIEVQQFCVFAPIGAVGVLITLAFFRWIILTTKAVKYQQY